MIEKLKYKTKINAACHINIYSRLIYQGKSKKYSTFKTKSLKKYGTRE